MTLHTFRVYQDAINLLLDDDADNYGTVNGLPVTSDRAEWLFCNCTSYTRRRLWAECAALMGNEHAASWIESDDLCEKGITLLSQAPDQAVPFLRQAAERGSSKAAYYLGLCLHHGDGVQANPPKPHAGCARPQKTAILKRCTVTPISVWRVRRTPTPKAPLAGKSRKLRFRTGAV